MENKEIKTLKQEIHLLKQRVSALETSKGEIHYHYHYASSVPQVTYSPLLPYYNQPIIQHNT